MAIDFSQVKQLRVELESAPGRVGAAASKALRKTAYAIEADAKALAPVDTGALRSSISTSFAGDGRSGVMAAEIGPSVDYGIYVEYGTSTQPGQPFMGPALERNLRPLEEAVAQAGERSLLDGVR